MKIHELVYEIRQLARKEEDPIKKDLFYQSAKCMEILGNLAKISDLAVAEHKAAEKPSINDEDIKWNIDDTTLKMMDDHLNTMVYYKFLSQNDRWPYDNTDFKNFVSKYIKCQTVKDSNIE